MTRVLSELSIIILVTNYSSNKICESDSVLNKSIAIKLFIISLIFRLLKSGQIKNNHYIYLYMSFLFVVSIINANIKGIFIVL
jgi:hypothetical protein